MDKKKSSLELPAANKNWPRYGKKREKQNQNNQTDSTHRSKQRQNFEKRPTFFNDKRPKPRNANGNASFNNNNYSLHATASGASGLEYNLDQLDKHIVENDEDIDDDNTIELNSIYRSGSKKQNLNHLLNFHYSPREENNVFGRGNHSGISMNKYRNVKKHKYNKEQYLQANFQFVVKSSANDFIDYNCPDILIDWNNIEQINVQTTEEPQCPICLYVPVAAKLTRCGHIYCWTCILHYLALSDKIWRKCPICYDAVYAKDLKSTLIIQQTDFKVNDFVTFQLMRRKKNSIFCQKVIAQQQDDEKNQLRIPHLMDSDDKKRFSKFVLADYQEILSVLEKEQQELMTIDIDCPESVFTDQALDLLNKRRLELNEEITTELGDLVQSVALNAEDNDKDLKNYVNDIQSEISTTGTLPKDNKYYYFYQSVDGQNIFLHPLNVRMIQAMYGSLENGPLLIEGKILQKEAQSMDEEMRKKFTCLGHLPLTCQFSIVEVEMTTPTVSEEILQVFKEDILMRHKIRQRKLKEENKRDRKINYYNERRIGNIVSRSANIDIQSAQQFPFCGSDDSFSQTANIGGSIEEDTATYSQVSNNQETSFAKILSSPKKEYWPSLSGLRSELNPVVNYNKATSQALKIPRNQTFDSDGEDSIHMTHNNLADVVAEALQKSGTRNEQKNKKKSRRTNKTFSLTSGMNFSGN